MVLPESVKQKAFLFHDLCPVRFSSNHPVFPFKCTDELISIQLLRMFQLGKCDPIPRIVPSDKSIAEATLMLKPYANPIAFCPTSSRTHAHTRQRPPSFWDAVLPELKDRFAILQFGFDEYPLVRSAIRFPFVTLEILAAVYHLIGKYIGVHTGDHHLMIAAGGKAVVAEPDPMPDAGHDIHWNYHTIPNRIQYGKLSNPASVIRAIRKLGV